MAVSVVLEPSPVPATPSASSSFLNRNISMLRRHQRPEPTPLHAIEPQENQTLTKNILLLKKHRFFKFLGFSEGRSTKFLPDSASSSEAVSIDKSATVSHVSGKLRVNAHEQLDHSFGKTWQENFWPRHEYFPDLHDTNQFLADSGCRQIEDLSQSNVYHGQSFTLQKYPSPTGSDPSFDEKYRFCSSKIIGRGGSGVVRLAQRAGSDTIYAVKEFRKKRKDEPARNYIKKLTAEYCISSMLHHTNIVETYDMIRNGNHWYEIMEYCPGGDLFSVIRDGHLTADDVDMCFRQLLQGVHYLHKMGVAHRDLKPENLLIDGHGRLRITDFGASDVFHVCWEKSSHLSKGICGSAPYIAPEVFDGGEYDAAAVDIWACAIIYYAMTFHGIPWAFASPKDPHYRQYLQRRGMGVEPLVRMPHGPQVLLRKMLEPDPKLRITINEALEDEWIKSIKVYECRFSERLSSKINRGLSASPNSKLSDSKQLAG